MIKTKEYTLSKQNYRKFIRKEFLKNSKVLFLITALVFIGIGSISVYGFINLGNNKILEAWAPFIVLVFVFWLYMLFYVPYTSSNSKLNTIAFNKWQYTFNEIGFIAESDEEYKISAKYSSIPKVSIDGEYIMLYLNSTFVLLIPKEVFHQASDFNEVLNNF